MLIGSMLFLMQAQRAAAGPRNGFPERCTSLPTDAAADTPGAGAVLAEEPCSGSPSTAAHSYRPVLVPMPVSRPPRFYAHTFLFRCITALQHHHHAYTHNATTIPSSAAKTMNVPLTARFATGNMQWQQQTNSQLPAQCPSISRIRSWPRRIANAAVTRSHIGLLWEAVVGLPPETWDMILRYLRHAVVSQQARGVLAPETMSSRELTERD